MAFCEFWFWSGRTGGTCRLFRSKADAVTLLPGALAGPKGCTLPLPATAIDPVPLPLPTTAVDPVPKPGKDNAEADSGRTEAVLTEEEVTTPQPLPVGKSEVAESSMEDEKVEANVD